MKILIDEQLPTKLKFIFQDTGYEVLTVCDMKWLGTKNGSLLELMSVNNFNVSLTNDKNLYYQQKITALKVCIVNINSKTNRYDDVFEKIHLIKNKLEELAIHLKHAQGGYFTV